MSSIARSSTGVQYAGYLRSWDGGVTKKYWCVIRDGHFLVYPSHTNEPIETDEGTFGVEDRPVYKFPIQDLIISASVTQIGNNGQQDCVLELSSSRSDEKINLHTTHVLALQRWVDAVKKASYQGIDASFDSPAGQPLPPALDFNNSYPGANLHGLGPSHHLQQFRKPIKSNIQRTDVSEKAIAESSWPEVNANYKYSNPLNTSLLFSKLSSKEAAKYIRSSSWNQPRDGVNTPQSSSGISTPASIRSSAYKDSADESSVSSSVASSPVVTKPQRDIFNSDSRRIFPKHENQGSSAVSSLGKKNKPRSPMFYTGEKDISALKSTPGMRHVKKRSNATTLKRHTVSSIPGFADSSLSTNSKEKILASNDVILPVEAVPGPTRHTIAPISHLDQQIQIRSKVHRQRTHSPVIETTNDEQLDSDSSLESPEETASLDGERLPPDEDIRSSVPTAQTTSNLPPHTEQRNSSTHVKITTSELETTPTVENVAFEGIPSPVHKLKRRLLENSRAPGDSESKSTANGDFGISRNRSGSFGSRLLRRAKSAVGKRNKSFESEDKNTSSMKSPNSDPLPACENNTSDVEKNVNNRASVNGTRVSKPRILMEGPLYRTKIMKWQKYWAVLDSNKTLSFYKNEEQLHSSDPATHTVALASGCEVINISQAKNNNIFTLLPLQSKTHVVDQGKSIDAPVASKPVQLMCKSTQEFVHWMKAFVQVNTTTTHSLAENRSLVKLKARNFTKTIENDTSSDSELLGAPKPHALTLNSKSQSAIQASIPLRVNESELFKFNTNHKNASDFGLGEHKAANIDGKHEVKCEVVRSNPVPEIESRTTSKDVVGSGSFDREELHLEYIDADDVGCGVISTSGEVDTFHTPEPATYEGDCELLQREMNTTVFSSHLLKDTLQVKADVKASDVCKKKRLGNRLLLADTNKTTSTCRIDASELAGSSNSPTIDGGPESSSHASNNGLAQEQWACAGIKTLEVQPREISANTNKSLSGFEACRSRTEATDSASLAVPRRGGVEPLKLISRRVGESDEGCSGQTIAVGGRSSNDKRILSHRLPSSLASSVQKPLPSRLNSIFPSSSSGSSSDQQWSRTIEACNSVSDVKLFEDLSSSADDCSEKSFNKECSSGVQSPKSQTAYITVKNNLDSNIPATGVHTQDINKETKFQSFGIASSDISVLQKLTVTSDKFEPAFLNLRRSKSEGNILEPTSLNPRYRMRTIKSALPELTRIDFIEIYGISPSKGNRSATSSTKDHSQSLSDHDSESDYLARSSVSGISGNKDISDDGYRSSGNTNDNVAPSKQSKESSVSEESTKEEKRSSNWFSTFRRSIKSNDDEKSKIGKAATVLKIPASRLSSASHRGYVDRRNKKKQWERFWCVLQDSCLYCYNSPQSDVTRDVVLLRGYDVIADVTNMNRSRFVFRLEQQGAQTLYFGSDNHEEFLLWVGTLEKDTRCVTTPNRMETENRTASTSPTHSDVTPVESYNSRSSYKRTASKDELEQELVEMQKHKLLKEIVAQQQQLIEEHRLLEGKVSENSSVNEMSLPRRTSRRNDVIDKFERVRSEEETKMTKFMTLLNRRRNSAQLKVDQLSREIAPKSGKKRRQNHQNFAAYEAKLNEMKQRLAEIDEEIHEQQAQKQSVMEKLQERQDLELLVAEQQESLAIMRRHQNDEFPFTVQRRRKAPREALTSIEELSSISDCCSSSSDSMNEAPARLPHAMSTPRCKRTKQSVSFDSVPSEEFYQCEDDAEPMSASSLDGVIASSSMSSSVSSLTVSRDSLNANNPLESKKSEEIDPSVMAGIEMFEEFTKLKLGKQRE
nr:uncharacterized protein LOC100176971 isoform X2 [Ciona intestinalis]|eukprot:XP_018667342.1 uncharacterized protein LOC100176971 isoform X2 [Ciona intestinalis]